MVALVQMVGKRFGEMLVIAPAETASSGHARWLCRCSCGVEKVVRGQILRRGESKSCGAPIHRQDSAEHGHARVGQKTPEYRCWANMIQRCNNPSNTSYARYGGRGIAVCDRWMTFANFLADMGQRPTPLHTIDRKDGDKNYEPGNCVWATRREQVLNRAYTKMSDAIAVAVRSSKRSQRALAAEYGVSESTISAIRSGRNWKEAP